MPRALRYSLVKKLITAAVLSKPFSQSMMRFNIPMRIGLQNRKILKDYFYQLQVHQNGLSWVSFLSGHGFEGSGLFRKSYFQETFSFCVGETTFLGKTSPFLLFAWSSMIFYSISTTTDLLNNPTPESGCGRLLEIFNLQGFYTSLVTPIQSLLSALVKGRGAQATDPRDSLHSHGHDTNYHKSGLFQGSIQCVCRSCWICRARKWLCYATWINSNP